MGTGVFSGFFGIGGGFLIVPGLMASTDMVMINAIGSSLVAVTAFGLTTAANYAFSGLVDWLLAGGVHRRRIGRRGGRHQGRPAPVGRGSAEDRVCGADLRGGGLYALEKLGRDVTRPRNGDMRCRTIGIIDATTRD